MADLVWYDFYTLGVESIDGEHRQILALMQQVQGAIEAADLVRCSALLQQLLDVTSDHFRNEEAYLRLVGFPGIDEHALYHREMVVKAEHVKSICEGIEGEHDLQGCFDGLVRFLIDDILKGDLQFKSYLEYHKLTDR